MRVRLGRLFYHGFVVCALLLFIIMFAPFSVHAEESEGSSFLSQINSLFAPIDALDEEEASPIPYGEFANVSVKGPDLYVKKIVESSIAGADIPEDTVFNFVIQINGGYLREQPYELYDADGQQILRYYNTSDSTYYELNAPPEDPHYVLVEWKTDRNGGFTLKDGQTAKFCDLDSGAEYDVFEEDLPDRFRQTTPAGNAHRTGTVEPEGSTVEFVNTWYPEIHIWNPNTPGEETTDLEVSKRVLLPDGFEVPDPDATFKFTLSVGYEAYAQKTYYLFHQDGTPVTDESGQQMTGTTGADGSFTLHGEEVAQFQEVPVDKDYEVTEDTEGLTDGWRQTGVTGQKGSVTSPLTRAEFTNALASFAVSKRMADGSVPETDFQFRLKVGSVMISGAKYYLYDENGQLVNPEVQSTGEDGIFKLKAGQTALFVGITAGSNYTVEELTQEGYVQTVPESNGSFSGTVRDDALNEHTFVNDLDTKVALRIRKTDEEHTPLENVKFELHQGGSGSKVYGQFESTDTEYKFTKWDTVSGTELATKLDGTIYLTGLEPGVFTLSEKEPLEGYKELEDITFEIRSTDHGDEIVLNSSENGRTDVDVGTDTDGTLLLTAINEKQTGDLSVTKTVTGNAKEDGKEFSFTVTLSNDQITGLYGLDADTGMDFTSGEAHFVLHDGETRTATGLPAGITYTVVEQDPSADGYIVTKTGDTGTIVSDTLSEAGFTNTKSLPKKEEVTPGAGTNVRDGEEITYRITYENATPDVLNIVITDKLDPGVDFVSATGGGVYDAATHTVTWTLNDVPPNTLDQEVTLTVKVNEKAQTKVDNTAQVQFGDLPEISTETITNPVVGDLSVTKTVTGNAAEEGKAFTFQVTLSDTTISGVYGADDVTGMTFAGGIANFTLQNGETRTATDLPAGITYTVTEQTEEGYLTVKTGETGTITSGGMAQAEFTNTRSTSHKTEETPGDGEDVRVGEEITFKISYENATPEPLNIIITDVLEEGLEFSSASDGGTYEPSNRTVTWNLQDVAANTLDKFVALTVTVSDQAIEKVENSASVQYGDLPSITTETTTNPVVSDLSVTKTVTGSRGDKTKDWHFTVTLSDTTVNGVFGDDALTGMTFTDGVAEFTLKHGETKTAKDLPTGITYTVTEQEENQDMYKTTKKNDTGSISPLEEAKAEFTNERTGTANLPSTGGFGTSLVLIFSLLMCLSGLMIVRMNRRSTK